MLVLTALPFSPWSEKARWALDHHQIPYQYEEYIPLLGELKLRLRMRKPRGRVSVPVLNDQGTWLTDSLVIAEFAEKRGRGSRLFPAAQLTEIRDWNARSEAALSAGRAKLMLAMAEKPEQAINFLPFSVPKALKPLLVPVANKAVGAFIAKYKMRDTQGQHEATLNRELDALRKALAGRRYLIGDALSYADIAMAVVLQGILPVDERYMARIPGVMDSAYSTELQHRYADLLKWRDELYANHRLR